MPTNKININHKKTPKNQSQQTQKWHCLKIFLKFSKYCKYFSRIISPGPLLIRQNWDIRIPSSKCQTTSCNVHGARHHGIRIHTFIVWKVWFILRKVWSRRATSMTPRCQNKKKSTRLVTLCVTLRSQNFRPLWTLLPFKLREYQI